MRCAPRVSLTQSSSRRTTASNVSRSSGQASGLIALQFKPPITLSLDPGDSSGAAPSPFFTEWLQSVSNERPSFRKLRDDSPKSVSDKWLHHDHKRALGIVVCSAQHSLQSKTRGAGSERANAALHKHMRRLALHRTPSFMKQLAICIILSVESTK